MKVRGEVFRFGDDINTDFIISGRYKFAITDMRQLSHYLFEDIRPGFYRQLQGKIPIIVAGENFGMGSSREQAPWVIKEAKIKCVVAKSFARIFYRNSFNIGLPLIEADTAGIKEKDRLIIDFDKGIIENVASNCKISFKPWNKFQLQLIKQGGIVNYLKKYGDFKV